MPATQEKTPKRETATPRESDAERESTKQTTPPASGSGSNGQSSRSLTDAAASIAGKFESAAAEKAESAVSGRGFATVLGWAAENVLAVARIGSDVADLAIRNLRLAGRRDLARLGVQQARTEDKLEQLLQEVERLEVELRSSREQNR
jgi:hypothetical protein